jgi:hypothetical protein
VDARRTPTALSEGSGYLLDAVVLPVFLPVGQSVAQPRRPMLGERLSRAPRQLDSTTHTAQHGSRNVAAASDSHSQPESWESSLEPDALKCGPRNSFEIDIVY